MLTRQCVNPSSPSSVSIYSRIEVGLGFAGTEDVPITSKAMGKASQ